MLRKINKKIKNGGRKFQHICYIVYTKSLYDPEQYILFWSERDH